MTKGVAVTTKRKEQSVYKAGALSGRQARDAYEWDAVGGSERLRDAIHCAVTKFAADNAISPAEAAAMLIGRETRISSPVRLALPHDPVGHRPSEIVAKPIGEIIQPIVARTLARGIA